MQLLLDLVLIVVLLAVSASVSGAETAFFSLSPAQIDHIELSKRRQNRAIVKLLAVPDYLLATLLIVNNLVNICVVILSNAALDGIVQINSAAWEFVIKTVLITFLLLLFGEIMPKVFANYNPVVFAKRVSIPVLWLKHFFKPCAWLLVRYSKFIRDSHAPRAEISIGELSDALDITDDQSREERKMLSGIVSLANREVVEIMHSRIDITALDIEQGFDAVRRLIVQSGYSRIPVYRGSIDHIEGVLYVKDMLRFIDEADSFEWQKHLRSAHFVPDNKLISDLLEEFQLTKVHIAIVVDEYGSTEGLVSLEDILEQIVGEITDESDSVDDERFYDRIDQNTYIFEAKTHLGDVESVLKLDEGTFDDVRGEAETIAGLMLEQKRDFLKQGDTMKIHGVKFTVASTVGHRADRIKVVSHSNTDDQK